MANTLLLLPGLNFYRTANIMETLGYIFIEDFVPLGLSHSVLYHQFLLSWISPIKYKLENLPC